LRGATEVERIAGGVEAGRGYPARLVVAAASRDSTSARRTVVLAQEECRRLGHAQIDPERLLLALLMQDEAMATRLLINAGVDVGAMRRDLMGPGSQPPQRAGHVPFNPLAKRVLELSLREAITLQHQHIGTQHLLLALIRVDGSAAATALQAAGADLECTGSGWRC
jgi:ATP-dependent Clp protease ATP-binding subunit ClpC